MVNFCIIGFTINFSSTQCLIQLSCSSVPECFLTHIHSICCPFHTQLSFSSCVYLLILVWSQSLCLIVIIKAQATSYTFKQHLRVKICFSFARPYFLRYVFYLEKTLKSFFFFFYRTKKFFLKFLRCKWLLIH